MSAIDIDDVSLKPFKLRDDVRSLLRDSQLDGRMSEFSKSGTGLHIYVPLKQGDVTQSFRTSKLDWTKSFEYYTWARHIVVNNFDFTKPVPLSHHDTLKFIHSVMPKFEKQITDVLRCFKGSLITKTIEDINDRCKCDPKLNELWNASSDSVDQSAHDLGLMTKLIYYCDNNKGNALDLFMSSPYCLTKDKKHLRKLQRQDYIQRLLDKN